MEGVVPLDRQVSHAATFMAAVTHIAETMPVDRIEVMAMELCAVRARGGRLFIIGVGGSAANCSHAVNDFRKLCGIEAYSPVDNVAELTARTNDEGWEGVFVGWLETSRVGPKDAILVLSVGGGDAEKGISANIVRAIDLAKVRGAKVLGIVGRAAGDTARRGDCVVMVPEIAPALVTPLSEAFQAVVWHALVSHPALQVAPTKW